LEAEEVFVERRTVAVRRFAAEEVLD